ncbi:Mg2+ transporter protein, Zinc transport protein [Fagus crenata]
MPRNVLWTDGLICAFEFIRGQKKSISSRVMHMTALHAASSSPRLDGNKLLESSSLNDLRSNEISSFDDNKYSQIIQSSQFHGIERHDGSHWVPISWARISELVQNLEMDANLTLHQFEPMDDEADLTIADLAAPYWEHPAGPIWWCHWLHPAVSLALKDESRLISERMKHLLYEVDFLLPYVLDAQNFLINAMHIKGNVPRINVLGITEVQELLSTRGYNTPRTVHEVIAHLAFRLSRWDDRLFRKDIFGDADEIELKRNQENMDLFSIILNQEIKKLSTLVCYPAIKVHGYKDGQYIILQFLIQVIRVKWPLHAREEIVFELLQHLRGYAARNLLKEIRKSTREMIEEQEAVCGRLFTIQDVLQSTVRAWLQDKSLRVTHNLVVFGGCGLVLSTITGLFGINVDLIPGAKNTPYAFGLFAATLVFLGVLLIVVGIIFLGLKKPGGEKQVEVRTFELQELVKMFQLEAETHGQVRKKHFSEKHAPNCW